MKKTNKILSIIFVALLIIPASSFLFHHKEKVLNEDEMAFPEFDNNFFSNLAKYLENQFAFRSEAIELNKQLTNKYDIKFKNFLNDKAGGGGGWTSSSNEGGEYDSEYGYLAPVVVNQAIYGREDWLFYSGDDSLDFYQGKNIPTKDEINDLLLTYLKLVNICEKKGINLVYLICPNKEQVYNEYMPTYPIYDRYKREERLRDRFETTKIQYLYPIEEMKSAKSEGILYWKQDTHWNSRGAFIAYKAFMQRLGYSVGEPKFKLTQRSGGDLSNMCGFSTTYDDWSVSYRSSVSYVDSYASNPELDHTISSSAQINKKLYIVGDSFRNNLKGYAFKDFKEVYCVHKNEILREDSLKFLSSLSKGDTILLQAVERQEDGAVLSTNNILNNIK